MPGLNAHMRATDLMLRLSGFDDDLIPCCDEERMLIDGIHEYGLEEEYAFKLIKAYRKARCVDKTINPYYSKPSVLWHLMPMRNQSGPISVLANIDDYASKSLLMKMNMSHGDLSEMAKKISAWEDKEPDIPIKDFCKEITQKVLLEQFDEMVEMSKLFTPDFTRAIVAYSSIYADYKHPLIKACTDFDLNTLIERDDKEHAGKVFSKLRQMFPELGFTHFMDYVIRTEGAELDRVVDTLSPDAPYKQLGPLIVAINPNMAPLFEEVDELVILPHVALEVNDMETMLDLPVNLVREAYDYAYDQHQVKDFKLNLVKAINEGCGSEYIHSLLSSIHNPDAYGGGHYERLACQA